jgi:hypothetical protein
MTPEGMGGSEHTWFKIMNCPTKGIPFSFATRIKKNRDVAGLLKHCSHIADHFGMTICIYTYIHGVYIYIYAQYIYDIIMNQHDQPLASARPQITLHP